MSLLFGTINWEFESFEPDTSAEIEGTMTLRKITTPGIFERLLGRQEKAELVQFRGGSTVWYSFPGFKRQSTFREVMLCGFWQKWRYKIKKADLCSLS